MNKLAVRGRAKPLPLAGGGVYSRLSNDNKGAVDAAPAYDGL